MDETFSPDSLSHHAVSRNYDRLSRWYDLFSPGERRFTAAGLQLLDLQPGERLLEVGPGTGHALAALARTGHVHGIDLSPGMLRVARRRLSRLGLAARAHLLQGDAVCLPYPEGCFEAVFLGFTLELFPDSEMPLVLAECRRILLTGGRLGVVSLVKDDLPAVRVYEWFHARLPAVVDCRPIRLTPLLLAAGFEIRKTVEERIWGLPAMATLSVRT